MVSSERVEGKKNSNNTAGPGLEGERFVKRSRAGVKLKWGSSHRAGNAQGRSNWVAKGRF